MNAIDVRIRRRLAAPRGGFPFVLDVVFQTTARTTVLLGPSGAGKTLTLDCLAGFLKPDEGHIRVAGTTLFDAAAKINLTPQSRQCGYVLQNYALFPHMTVRQNLCFAVPEKTSASAQRVSEMLERFRLAELQQRHPHQLSGGQQQRCSIARALLREPRVLLLDEPARGLDVLLREELYATLRQVQREFATPILLVTHDWKECSALGEYAVLLEEGAAVQAGTLAELEKQPNSGFLRHLLGQF